MCHKAPRIRSFLMRTRATCCDRMFAMSCVCKLQAVSGVLHQLCTAEKAHAAAPFVTPPLCSAHTPVFCLAHMHLLPPASPLPCSLCSDHCAPRRPAPPCPALPCPAPVPVRCLCMTGGPASAADMPGTGSKRRAAIRSRAVTLSPTGQSWAAATTEGLLLYSLDQGLVFDPTDLTEDITPAAAFKALSNRAFVRALLIALRLKDPDVVRHVIMSTPPNQVRLYSAQCLASLKQIAIQGRGAWGAYDSLRPLCTIPYVGGLYPTGCSL